MEEFIGLRSMLYSFLCDDMEKTVKGVKHMACKRALCDHCSMRHSMNLFRCYNQLFQYLYAKHCEISMITNG